VPKRFNLADSTMEIVIVVVEWVTLFRLNSIFFAQFAHSERASWIFPPAALRVISVLLFGWTGAVGLSIGSFLTLPHEHPTDLAYEVALALTSGAAPWIAIALSRRRFAIPNQLSTLRASHVIIASIATAAVNSALVNACMVMADRWHGDAEQIATIIVGDILGAAIVLALVVLLARLITRRTE
jgi:integral membrane sensor domain MASE1